MHTRPKRLILTTLLIGALASPAAPLLAVEDTGRDEGIRIAAVEALATATPERAIPLIERVLAGDGSEELKKRALFVLGQFGGPTANELLFRTAESGSPELRVDALRAIGISGDPDTLARVQAEFPTLDTPGRMAALEAFMIAGYAEGVVAVAESTDDPETFDQAVELLTAMGEIDALRALEQRFGDAVPLIEAYMVSGDVDALVELARSGADVDTRAEAIRALGVSGGEEVAGLLASMYREASDPVLRDAARDALFVGGQDAALMTLYRESTDAGEKRRLLETLIHMDSPAAWAIVEETLAEGE